MFLKKQVLFLKEFGLELLEYRGSSPLYLLYNIIDEAYTQMSFDKDIKCYKKDNNEEITLGTIPQYNKRIDDLLFDKATEIMLVPGGEIYHPNHYHKRRIKAENLRA